MTQLRLRRSVLYVPASNARALAKAAGLPCDGVILDLEDGVAPSAKEEARQAAIAAVGHGFGPRECVVRVNGLGTAWGAEDLRAVREARPDAVLVPKIERADDAMRAVEAADGCPVWVMVETPRAVIEAPAIADTPGVEALVAGLNDLALALRASPGADRAELAYGLGAIVLAARAAGIAALDGVATALDDPAAVERECAQAAAFGFDGKTLVHPSQIEPANRAFTPDAAAVELARALIAAYEACKGGAASFRGQLIEALHVERARQTLALAQAAEAARKVN